MEDDDRLIALCLHYVYHLFVITNAADSLVNKAVIYCTYSVVLIVLETVEPLKSNTGYSVMLVKCQVVVL